MMSLPVRLLAALTTLCLLVACGDGTDSAGETTQGGGRIPDTPAVITGEPAGYNAADVAFASAMVPHHQQAIEMASMAQQRSTNPELVTLANRIVAMQQPEVNILNVFLVQWNENPENRTGAGAEDAQEPAADGTVDDATIAQLESLRGPDFDKLWLASMIGQHQGAVAMAKSEISDGKNVDAIAVAETIVSGQDAEISQMRRMLEGMP